MTKVDTAELRRKAQAATPGPWKRGIGNDCYRVFDSHGNRIVNEDGHIGTNNGDFIAAANPATVLALIDALEADRQTIANARALIVQACELMTPEQAGKWRGVRSWLEAEAVNA